VFSRLRIEYHTVTIGVPLVPIIVFRRLSNLVLRLIACTFNRDELTLRDARASLRGRNLYFALTNEHFSMIVRRN
jgi:hypothetical protein